MIERQIVAQKSKERAIEEFVFSYLGRVSCSHIMMQRTPLGEKISVYTSRPGLIVGKKGSNIKKLTELLKAKFNMENPQLEVVEITNPFIDAASVARSLISGFERFGPKRFKAMAYKALDDALKAGARGIEIVISGRGVPSERAKSWRFSAGYLKKSGDISANYVDRSYEYCNLRSGTIGIKVSILHPEVVLPDDVKIKEEKVEVKLEVKKEEENNGDKKE
ncbi:30S ribosomal protein S3 [Candidatus Woesearchaeota archaeon]|nr:30S ribosomal protein S3 [Candidatus Woesearchaeota archaeon]